MVKIEGSEMYLIPPSGELLKYQCSVCNKKEPYPIWSTNERYQILDNTPKCHECNKNVVCYDCEGKWTGMGTSRYCPKCISIFEYGHCCSDFAKMLNTDFIGTDDHKYKPNIKYKMKYNDDLYGPVLKFCPYCGKEL